MGAAFDLLTTAASDIRTASLYAGLVVLLTCAPLAILLWRVVTVFSAEGIDLFSVDPTLDPETYDGPFLSIEASIAIEEASGAILLAGFVAFAGFLAASVDARAMMAALLGARLAGRRLSRRDALRRARMTFWPMVGAGILIGIPTGTAQTVLAEILRGSATQGFDFPDVAAALIVAIAAAPLVYSVAGIVLGAVGPVVTLGRSVTLFRARKGAGLVVALFAFAGQFIVVGGLVAGADVVIRAFEALDLAGLDPRLHALISILAILVFVFAIGSLMATVSALEIAPQALMFVALTHVAPGLETVDRPADVPPRTITGPMVIVFAIGLLALMGGLSAMAEV